ncbi:unnamed protein product [Rhizophagus irregularis]|nr:unnamed protein product [Rhizophagus irregularis]
MKISLKVLKLILKQSIQVGFLNFKNLPEPVNSSELSSFQVNSVSECLNVQFSESDLNEINQEEENLNDES